MKLWWRKIGLWLLVDAGIVALAAFVLVRFDSTQEIADLFAPPPRRVDVEALRARKKLQVYFRRATNLTLGACTGFGVHHPYSP